jgi:hypothetical protein
MNKINILFFTVIIFLVSQTISVKGITSEEMRSPVNQVFQFMQSGICSAWADSTKRNATVYLWIPENCKKVRGLLVMGANVPEHILVGDPSIRKVCADNDLAIAWSVPSILYFSKMLPRDKHKEEYPVIAGFLQQLLDGLAVSSGYNEIATVPWLPIGESGHLEMVDALLESNPNRCIATIYVKNNHLPPVNREVPTLVAYGTAQEWGQDKSDIRSKWNDVRTAYEATIKNRKDYPNWAFSYVVDGSSGHFDCSDRLMRYFARYIDFVAKARLSDDGSAQLKPINLVTGFLADLPMPGHENNKVTSFSLSAPDKRALPWYFDKVSAEEAQAIAAINWKADTQLVGVMNAKSDSLLPYNFNGIQKINSLQLESDGITFTINSKRLDQIPANFVAVGEKLAQTSSAPVVEWGCGQFEPLGNSKFRIALDRTWPNGADYFIIRQKGSDKIREIVTPVAFDIKSVRNTDGKAQKISFNSIVDVKQGTKSIDLVAKSDAGLPVEFYVVSGPAIIKNGKLIFTQIPPRSHFPITVTVAAWQWGTKSEPKVKMAEIVKQKFNILP